MTLGGISFELRLQVARDQRFGCEVRMAVEGE